MSDDELMILDFLALDGGVPLDSLYAENYSLHRNTPYSHNITHQELPSVLADMQKRGLISSYVWFHKKQRRTIYEITLLGGEQWESERTPVWRRLCLDSHEFGENGELLSFRCVDQEIGRTFAEVCLQAQLYNFPLHELRLTIAPSDDPCPLSPWKTFPREFVWTVRPYPESEEYVATDWALYHQNRCWWRDLDELQLFLSSPGPENVPCGSRGRTLL